MTSTDAEPIRCMRPGCGRRLTAAASIAHGYGRTCRRRIREAAETADLTAFKPWQVDKAREAIAEQAIVPTSRDGIYSAVSGDGTTVYLVDADLRTCTCKAGEHGRHCYHLAGALILQASHAAARKAAA